MSENCIHGLPLTAKTGGIVCAECAYIPPVRCNHLVGLIDHGYEGLGKLRLDQADAPTYSQTEHFRWCPYCGEKLDWTEILCSTGTENTP